MALDSTPQPSPVGKSSPPTKHQCKAASPCVILLSEVGKRHHTFPKGSFKARFIPPAVLIMVRKHLSAHPLFWSWTVKAGPNAGKSFRVPTVPTSCGRDSPQAVQWLVSAFHAFKAQLMPKAIGAKTGQVLPAYVKVYQNNMLQHLVQQQAVAPPAKATPPSKSKAPPGHIPPLPPPRPQRLGSGSSLTASWRRLRKSDQNPWHFGLSSRNSRTPMSHPVRPRPTLAAPHTLLPQQCPPHPPSPSTASSISTVQEGVAHPSHGWLQPILDHDQCSAFLKHVDSSMVPIPSYTLPDDVPQSVIATYTKGSLRHLGLDSNGDLCVAATGISDKVVVFLALPSGVPLPPPIPSLFEQ
ncbi:hypothetical protein SCLCIDRAFT_30334 [Scleroderma citrinum Foug A]|uniref:Uncharacterized protein n=1 Tax=Scleroderma citrinum Foug A TaxID=1036808 RepID=A0A0C3DGI3_9AGAM|nr:hypothetical protein SCLCIDRAFT_30334 [Scleroderma citrinum Foug A]